MDSPQASNGHQEQDKLLVLKAVEGDKEAYGLLYERYLRPIYQYIYYRIADPVDAEDLTEMVFIKAWEALASVDHRDFNIRPWLYRIAHNIVIDRYRTHKPSVALDTVANLGDSEGNPEKTYQMHESTQALAKAISGLDSVLQDVVIYRFVLGLSHKETAEIMNRSVIYIRVLQHRALQKLKEEISRESFVNG